MNICICLLLDGMRASEHQSSGSCKFLAMGTQLISSKKLPIQTNWNFHHNPGHHCFHPTSGKQHPETQEQRSLASNLRKGWKRRQDLLRRVQDLPRAVPAAGMQPSIMLGREAEGSCHGITGGRRPSPFPSPFPEGEGHTWPHNVPD